MKDALRLFLCHFFFHLLRKRDEIALPLVFHDRLCNKIHEKKKKPRHSASQQCIFSVAKLDTMSPLL